jgi:hypothetical protein
MEQMGGMGGMPGMEGMGGMPGMEGMGGMPGMEGMGGGDDDDEGDDDDDDNLDDVSAQKFKCSSRVYYCRKKRSLEPYFQLPDLEEVN